MSILTAAPTRTASVTDAACASIADAPVELSERELVDLAVTGALIDVPGGGWLNADPFVEVLWRRRLAAGRDADRDQTRDYVLYMLREAAHVCRHGDGHHYRVHPAERCSPDCDTRRDHTTPTARRDPCPSCFVELTTTGDCPMGC